jgi:hypothetical protein
VLRETTSRGLGGPVCPSRTSERGGSSRCALYYLWTLKSGVSRLRGHPEGPEALSARCSTSESEIIAEVPFRYSYNPRSAGPVNAVNGTLELFFSFHHTPTRRRLSGWFRGAGQAASRWLVVTLVIVSTV